MLQFSDSSGGSPRRETLQEFEGDTGGEESKRASAKTTPELPMLENEAVALEPPPEDAATAAPAVRESFEEGSSAGQTLYNRCALRVASIMRRYLSIREAGASRQPSAPPGTDRCGAMMEVVLKGHGKWTVSKLVAEHNHEVIASQETVGSGKDAILPPAVGMEFESAEAAKAFYCDYGMNSGFKARMGSNRRSAGSGALIMQRFLCWRWNYLMYRKGSAPGVGKRNRGPYRKMPHKLAGKVVSASAIVVQDDTDAANVVQVQRSIEKGAAMKEQLNGKVQSSTSVIGAAAPVEQGVMTTKLVSSTVDSKIASISASKSTEKTNLVANSSQSRLLRELGIKVSSYTEEERREIILKYMLKRTSRQNAEKPPKVPSRQAWAERRERGIGGRFLSRDEPMASNTQDGSTLTESDAPIGDSIDLGGEPKVGMVFVNEDKAYEFYVKYAGTIGFSVRKGWWDKSARNITRSRVYVCSREGFRPKNPTNEAKKPRLETRTGCPARMAIKLMPNGKYCVNEFVSDHNHQLAAPLDLQMLKSQRLPTKVQPVARQSAIQIPAGYKNYVRSTRMKNIQVGDASAMLQYLQKMKAEKPSFFYAIQVDQDDQLANFFWADPKSVMDYHFFGDVVCLDTSYKVNDYGRPFVLFTGVNHHRQMIVYGTAMLYDETVESFKWLFETFKSAMGGTQPKTLLTDMITGIDDAIADAYPGTVHRPCVWHICQNAKRYLNHSFEGFEDFALDFAKCVYDCEEEEEFLSLWAKMLEKYALQSDEWLGKLYKEKEDWALVYGHMIFYGDIFNTLRNENFHCKLQEFLKPDKDLLSFFNKYEKLIEECHYAERLADYHANQEISRIPPSQLLWQAANAYTPSAFELFRLEFELYMNCLVYTCGEVGAITEYEVTIKEKTKAQFVTFNSSDDSVVCSCKKFEFAGIPCCHILKVIDLRNIKELPPRYILKRWRKDAKSGSVESILGVALNDDHKSSLQKRYSSLCRILYRIAAVAAENEEAYEFMESQSDNLLEQVNILCAKLQEKPAANNVSKVQEANVSRSGGNGIEYQRLGGRNKKNGDSRHKHRKEMDSNIHQKGKKDVGPSADLEVPLVSDEAPVPNNIPACITNPSQFFAPSQFIQGSFGPGHQFALGGIQGFPVIAHFNQIQESSATALNQQPFRSSSQLNQSVVQAASDVNSLQFVEGNPQIEHQSTDQSHYTIPVWDFL